MYTFQGSIIENCVIFPSSHSKPQTCYLVELKGIWNDKKKQDAVEWQKDRERGVIRAVHVLTGDL